jgi:hypothetical protein
LARHAQPFRGQPGAQLEQRLTVVVAQLVEDGAPGRRGEGVEDVGDADTIGKRSLACKW